MADIEYADDVHTQDVADTSIGKGVARTLNVVGAAASLALIVGVGVWGYKLMIRDVSGVPVVRALEGPMRVQPDKPGGQPADHQGLAVNTVAAVGTAAAPADRLMLAPRPVELSDEDAPMGELVQPVSVSGEDISVDDLIAQLVNEANPLEQEQKPGLEVLTPAAQVVSSESQAEQADIQPAVLSGPGLPRSLRPQLRPARTVTAQPASFTPADSNNAVVDVAAETLPVGTRLAQLGAYDTPEIAKAEWNRLNVVFEGYLDGKSRVIQEAHSGGRTFYRLRAMGFSDINDARRFCSVLVAENADCIPVTTR